ncbi:MAG: SGNH/GDSL hydrolase family protein [Variovorax sp.]|nr:SGNH/GDSL hydrolase family protein [Variovorax sp.]
MTKRSRLLVACAASLVLALAVTALAWSDGAPAGATRPMAPAGSIPIAVLGDSNSQAYQDRITFPLGIPDRGGALRERTFQWTEVLARLRGNEIDFGPWVIWGRPWWSDWLRARVGLTPSRSPRKEDYLYNFANSGAACKNLMGDRLGFRFPQVPRLLSLMSQDPERWRQGVVVISIGPNDWNTYVDLQASDPSAAPLRRAVDYCMDQIGQAVAAIHAAHPTTRVLLLGWFSEASDPSHFDQYRDAASTANIAKSTDEVTAGLRRIADADPRRVALFDAHAWFVAHWGSRSPQGDPDFRTVQLGPLRITNTRGDEPGNALLADGHGGLAWNALWAQAVVARLREAFGLPLTPISDDEVVRFVTATGLN